MTLVKLKGGFVVGLTLGFGFGFGVPMGTILFQVTAAMLFG